MSRTYAAPVIIVDQVPHWLLPDGRTVPIAGHELDWGRRYEVLRRKRQARWEVVEVQPPPLKRDEQGRFVR